MTAPRGSRRANKDIPPSRIRADTQSCERDQRVERDTGGRNGRGEPRAGRGQGGGGPLRTQSACATPALRLVRRPLMEIRRRRRGSEQAQRTGNANAANGDARLCHVTPIHRPCHGHGAYPRDREGGARARTRDTIHHDCMRDGLSANV